VSTPGRRVVVATLSLLAAFVAAWLAPLLASVVVWPMLVVVPGWAIVAAVRPRIDAAGRLGLAVIVSVAVSTHLVHWLSHLAGGYGRGVVFAAAALLALPILLATWRGHRPPTPTRLRGATPVLLVAAGAAVIVGLTLSFGLWRVTGEGVLAGGTNWSDLGVHLSIAETLNAGANFPPEVPYFAGVPLVYHWFADFHAAILALAVDQFVVPSMVVQSTALAFALALLVGSLARLLFRGGHAPRLAALAAALTVFGGGMGYLRLIGDLAAGAGDPITLVTTTSYDNRWLTDWPYFRIPSVMGTGLLAHRATTAGLPLLVGALLLLVAGLPSARRRALGWRDRPALIGLAGLLGALLAPFHFFFFPAAPLLALGWVLAGGRLLDAAAARNALLFLSPYLLAVPFALPPLLQAGGSGAIQLVQGWPTAPREDGPLAVAFFYATNLGVPFALALAALVAPRLGHRAFLGAWLLGLFLVPNIVQLSPIDFDMNKYFQAMWISVAILAAWLVHRWPWPAIVAVLALSIPSPLLVAAWTATSNLQVLTRGELAAAAWVREATPAHAVFVTDGWVNALTDPAGRKRLTTFGPYVANLGYRPEQREADVREIYCGGDAERAARLMAEYGATHVVDGNRPGECLAPVDFGTSSRFELVYAGGPRIWELVDRP
jgi:hypothetical protein